MATGLVDVIKRITLNVINNAKLCDLKYGTVVSVSPLKVQITNQFIIPESALVVPRRLTDHTVETSINISTGATDNVTENTDEQSTNINTKTRLLIHNALKIGEKVVLLREQGGQSYFILDRI